MKQILKDLRDKLPNMVLTGKLDKYAYKEINSELTKAINFTHSCEQLKDKKTRPIRPSTGNKISPL